MKLIVAAVGRLREPYFRDIEAEYTKRLRPYCKLDVIEAKTDSALLSSIPQRARIYALDEAGTLITSRDLAESILANEEQHGRGDPIAFAIGGPNGHTQALRDRAHQSLAFGRITLGHRIARIVLYEQLYRGYKILRGEPYHRD